MDKVAFPVGAVAVGGRRGADTAPPSRRNSQQQLQPQQFQHQHQQQRQHLLAQGYVPYPRQHHQPNLHRGGPVNILQPPMSEQHVPRHHRRTHRRTTFYYSSSSSGSQSPTDEPSRSPQCRRIPYIEELRIKDDVDDRAGQDSDDERVQLDRYSSMPSSPRYVGAPIVMWQNAEPVFGSASPVPSLHTPIKQKRSVGIQAGRPKVKKFAFFSGDDVPQQPNASGDTGVAGQQQRNVGGDAAATRGRSRVTITYDDNEQQQQPPPAHPESLRRNRTLENYPTSSQRYQQQQQYYPNSSPRRPSHDYAVSDHDNNESKYYPGEPRYSTSSSQPRYVNNSESRRRQSSSGYYNEPAARGRSESDAAQFLGPASARGSVRRHHVHVHDAVEIRAVPPSYDHSKPSPRRANRDQSDDPAPHQPAAERFRQPVARGWSSSPVGTPGRQQEHREEDNAQESSSSHRQAAHDRRIDDDVQVIGSSKSSIAANIAKAKHDAALADVLQYLEEFGSDGLERVKSAVQSASARSAGSSAHRTESSSNNNNVTTFKQPTSSNTPPENSSSYRRSEETPPLTAAIQLQTAPVTTAIQQQHAIIRKDNNDNNVQLRSAPPSVVSEHRHTPLLPDSKTPSTASYSSAPTVGAASVISYAQQQQPTSAASYNTYANSVVGTLPTPNRAQLEQLMGKQLQSRSHRSFFRSPFSSIRRRGKSENVAGKSLERVVAMSQFSPNPVVKNAAINIDQRYIADSTPASVHNSTTNLRATTATATTATTVTTKRPATADKSTLTISQQRSAKGGSLSGTPMLPVRGIQAHAAGNATTTGGKRMAANTLHALIHHTVEHGKDVAPTLTSAINQRQRELFVERVQHEMVRHAKRRGSSPAAVLFWMSRIGQHNQQHHPSHPLYAVYGQTPPASAAAANNAKPAGLYTPQLPRRHLGSEYAAAAANNTSAAVDKGYTSDVTEPDRSSLTMQSPLHHQQQRPHSIAAQHGGGDAGGEDSPTTAPDNRRRESLIDTIKKLTSTALSSTATGSASAVPAEKRRESSSIIMTKSIVAADSTTAAASMPSSSGVERSESVMVVEIKQKRGAAATAEPPAAVTDAAMAATTAAVARIKNKSDIQQQQQQQQQHEVQVHSNRTVPPTTAAAAVNAVRPKPQQREQQQISTAATAMAAAASSDSSDSDLNAADAEDNDANTSHVPLHIHSKFTAPIPSKTNIPPHQPPREPTSSDDDDSNDKPQQPLPTAKSSKAAVVSSRASVPENILSNKTAAVASKQSRASVSSVTTTTAADTLLAAPKITEESSLLSKSQEDLFGGDEDDANFELGEFDENDPNYAAERLSAFQAERLQRIRRARWDRDEKLVATIQHQRPRAITADENAEPDADRIQNYVGVVSTTNYERRNSNSNNINNVNKISILLPTTEISAPPTTNRRSRSVSPVANSNSASWGDFIHTMPKAARRAKTRRADASWPGDVPSSAGGGGGGYSIAAPQTALQFSSTQYSDYYAQLPLGQQQQHLEQIKEEKESPTTTTANETMMIQKNKQRS